MEKDFLEILFVNFSPFGLNLNVWKDSNGAFHTTVILGEFLKARSKIPLNFAWKFPLERSYNLFKMSG